MHVADHKGEFFQVQGPLNIERPMQGYPVIAQAGQSEPGQELAAKTAEEAQEKLALLESQIHPTIGMQVLRRVLGADFSAYPVDGPIPDNIEAIERATTAAPTILKQAREQGLTIRQLYAKLSGFSGHHQLVGTAQTIDDHI